MNWLTRRLLTIGMIFGLAGLDTSPNVQAHNVYSSFTQIDWNAADNSIELVLQIHSHELETKLSLLLDQRLSFLEDDDFKMLETATGDFIKANISLVLDDRPVDLIFLGIETDGQTVIAYLEQDWAERPVSIDIMNTIFLEELPGQVNSVLAAVGGNRRGGDIMLDTGPLHFKF